MSTLLPKWIDPMLATLSHEMVEGDDWMIEPKLDGERCLVFVRNGTVALFSRNRKVLSDAYPELVDAFIALGLPDVILDGEIIVRDSQGNPSFALLQPRFSATRKDALADSIDVELVLFDVLHIEDKDVRSLSYLERRDLLRSAISGDSRLSVIESVDGDVQKHYDAACQAGLEGIVVKRSGGVYESGVRSRSWVKLKCETRQEFIILGFTLLKGTQQSIGALLLGYYDNRVLRYAYRS